MSAWQIKEWDFAQHTDGQSMKPILCQADEWEVWNATTQDMMGEFLADYRQHPGGGVIVGDATGNRRDTRSPSETDWTIIRKKLGEALDNFGVVPGLVKKKKKQGRRKGGAQITYQNPDRRETFTLLNNFMIDSEGDPRILFMPESKYPSGGVANAVANAEYDMESNLDDSNDKSDDRSLPRTHFFDGARYVVYFVNGRLIHPDPNEVRSNMKDAETSRSEQMRSRARNVQAYRKNMGGSTF